MAFWFYKLSKLSICSIIYFLQFWIISTLIMYLNTFLDDFNDKVHYQLDDNVADENDELDDNVADENDELDDNIKEEDDELNENDEVSQTDIKPAESDAADAKSIQSDITDLAQRDAEALHKKKGCKIIEVF